MSTKIYYTQLIELFHHSNLQFTYVIDLEEYDVPLKGEVLIDQIHLTNLEHITPHKAKGHLQYQLTYKKGRSGKTGLQALAQCTFSLVFNDDEVQLADINNDLIKVGTVSLKSWTNLLLGKMMKKIDHKLQQDLNQMLKAQFGQLSHQIFRHTLKTDILLTSMVILQNIEIKQLQFTREGIDLSINAHLNLMSEETSR